MTKIREYIKNDLTVGWQAEQCIHSEKCWKGLSEVFNPKGRPWINLDGASKEAIIEQVNKCPSGALSIISEEEHKKENMEIKDEQILETMANGPLMVYGNVTVKHNGEEIKKSKATAFCRCGHSANKPYCDGAHKAAGFQG